MMSKYFIGVLLLALLSRHASSQYVHRISADSVKITGSNGSGELIIENSTKNVAGYLYNLGNGRTEFRPASAVGGGWSLSGNSAINPATQFLGTTDSISLVFKTNNATRMTVAGNGQVVFGASESMSNAPFRFFPNGDFLFSSPDRNYGAIDPDYSNGLRYHKRMGYLEIGGTSNIIDTTLDNTWNGAAAPYSTSAIIMNGSNSTNTFLGKLKSSVINARGVSLAANKIIYFSQVMGSNHSINDTITHTYIGGTGHQVNKLIDRAMIFGESHTINGDYNSLWGGIGHKNLVFTSNDITSGRYNTIGSVSQLTVGNYLNNHSYAGVALGNRNVNFLSLPNHGVFELDTMTVKPGFLLFSLGNSNAKADSLESNAVTILYNGRTQINTNGFNKHLTEADVTPKAALEVVSSNSGVLLPRLTTAQRDSIISGDRHNGLLLYNKTINGFEYYNGSAWKNIAEGSGEKSVQPVTDSSTILWNYQTGSSRSVTLGGNRTLQITNAVNGSQGKLIIRQDATGNRKLTLPAGSLVLNAASQNNVLSSVANSVDYLTWLYDGTNYFWTIQSTYNPYFTPSSLANLVAWYRSDTAVTLSGSDVVAWNDISGNGRHLNTVTAGVRPVLQTNQLNGYPAIYGDGTKHLRTASAMPSFSTLTVYIVARQEDGDGNYGVFIDADYDKGFHIRRYLTHGQILAGADGYATPFGARQSASNNFFYTIRLRSNATTSYISLNNNTEASYTESNRTIAPAAMTLFSDPAGNYFGKKKIVEILIYSEEHNDAKRKEVEEYLRRRYGHY